MTAKVLKANGWVIHASTYRALTLDEMNVPEEAKVREEFDAVIKASYGDGTSLEDFDSDPDWETSMYEKYEDHTEDPPRNEPNADDVIPEVLDN